MWNESLPAPLILFFFLVLSIAVLVSLITRRKAILDRARANVLSMEVERARLRMEELERLTAEQERWAQLLINHAQDMIFAFSAKSNGMPGTLLDVNDAACETLRYPRERLLAMRILDIEHTEPGASVRTYARLHDADNTVRELEALTKGDPLEPEHVIDMRRRMKRVLQDGHAAFEQTLLTSDGRQIPVEVRARRFDRAGDPLILMTATDLTQHRETMHALSESVRLSRDFLAHSAVGTAVYDGARTLTSVNRIALRIFGIADQAEFAKLAVFEAPFVPSDSRDPLTRGEFVRFETVFDFDAARRDAHFLTTRTGRAHLDVLFSNLGVDNRFEPKGFLVQVQDITQRRDIEAELKQREIQLRQAQKLQAIGTLAGGVAHDFNNILTPVLGYTEMALDLSRGNETVSSYLREVIRASNRAKELANQILTFSRQVEPEGKPIRLIPIVKEVLNLQQAAVPQGIRIKRLLKTDQDVVIAQPSQIHQVLMNLCTNATHAMRGRAGDLEVTVESIQVEARARGPLANLAPGRYLHLAVRDTGTGIAPEIMDRLFDPFFTTKPRGEGTGMGLAVVHGIVASLKGLINVDSKIGAGSVFHVYLPAAEIGVETTEETADEIQGGSECILFVDDEVDIVQMQSRLLASMGYRPVVTHRPADALKMFTKDPARYDLIIADQVMPEMSGLDLARHVHAIKRGQPILICSGFIDVLPVDQARAFGVRDVLRKPVSKRELALAIRQALDT